MLTRLLPYLAINAKQIRATCVIAKTSYNNIQERQSKLREVQFPVVPFTFSQQHIQSDDTVLYIKKKEKILSDIHKLNYNAKSYAHYIALIRKDNGTPSVLMVLSLL